MRSQSSLRPRSEGLDHTDQAQRRTPSLWQITRLPLQGTYETYAHRSAQTCQMFLLVLNTFTQIDKGKDQSGRKTHFHFLEYNFPQKSYKHLVKTSVRFWRQTFRTWIRRDYSCLVETKLKGEWHRPLEWGEYAKQKTHTAACILRESF